MTGNPPKSETPGAGNSEGFKISKSVLQRLNTPHGWASCYDQYTCFRPERFAR